MANYFCTDSVEEQVDYLTDKVKDLKNSKLDKAAIVQEVGTGTDVVMSQKAVTDELSQKSNATNLENGTADVLIQTTDTNHSFKVMTDGRAKVQTAPIDDDDVVRKLELDKKLTAPTTPTADSAVTMLADGTVGTKPLSEIGSGGVSSLNGQTGALTTKTLFGTNSILGTGNIDVYKHVINFTDGDGDGFFNMIVYSSKSLVVDSLTNLKTLIGDAATENVCGFVYDGASSLYYPVFKVDTETLEVFYVHPQNGMGSVTLSDYTITDTVTTI